MVEANHRGGHRKTFEEERQVEESSRYPLVVVGLLAADTESCYSILG
jgi:hypothetical protein